MYILLTLWLLGCGHQQQPPADPASLSEEEKRKPENALMGMELHEGLEATLFAHEPMLINPTNIDVDARGRVWVCEAYNYRPMLNPANDEKAEGDRILILEDEDGDGKADTKKVFYQGTDINAALGIAVLGSRVMVSVSPHIFVLTDTDGDDKADNKEILFSMLGGKQHDHGAHAIVYGPDGKLYFNYGNAGMGIIDGRGEAISDVHGRPAKADGKPFHQAMLFRCNPDGSELEVLAHNFRNPYELAVDSYGSIWQSDNDDDGNKGTRINYIMEYGNYGYTDEMTGAGWRTRRTGMHEEIPLRHWHLNDPGVVPNLLQTGAGSPAGLIVYEGKLLPEVFQNQMIHCDPGPNVVRAYPVQTVGSGYMADIVPLMSNPADPWFRPVDVCAAPDGSLFVADWYDPGVGGHQMGDQAQGRIYRIAPKGSKYKIDASSIDDAESAVKALQSPNMATRYLAQEKLKALGTKAEPTLAALLKHDNPRMQARALFMLAGVEGKTDQYVQKALKSDRVELRMAALRAARLYHTDRLADYIRQLTEDPSRQVLREALVALRYLPSPDAAALWTALALQHKPGDRWYLEALGLAADPRAEEFFNAWLQAVGEQWNTPAGRDIVWRMRSPKALPLLAKIISDTTLSAKNMERYFRAFDFHADASKDAYLMQLTQTDHPEKSTIQRLVFSHISAEKVKSSPSLQRQLDQSLALVKGTPQFIDWVRRYNMTSQVPELERLFMTEPNSGMGQEAVRIIYQWAGLSFFENKLRSNDEEVVGITLSAMTHLGGHDAWLSMKEVALDSQRNMAIRRKAVKAMGTGWVAEDSLLAVLDRGLLPSDLETTAATTLLTAIKGSVREAASGYLDIPEGSELPAVTELVAMKGDASQGKLVYDKFCSTCHIAQGIGVDFGPELSSIGDKLSRDGLYAAIIYPDAGINFGYEGYMIKTTSGETAVGYIASRTDDEIVLKKMGGITSTYRQSDIASMQELENSLMTSGFHRVMSQDDLVNLVEYLSMLKKDVAMK